MFYSTIDIPPPTPQKITVFVHGTGRTARFIPSLFGLDKRFRHTPGLFKASSCYEGYCYHRMAKNLSKYAPQEFPYEHFYLFCWDGALSHEKRVKAAQELHKSLNKIHSLYKNKPYTLTLITHSHGGNVALNLAGLQETKPYSIDRLILLACPVQEKTKDYISSTLFKDIYAPYSSWDFLQIADLQGAHPRRKYVRNILTHRADNLCFLTEQTPLFSKRKFIDEPRVKHIHIKMNKRPITHIEFLLKPFSRKLADILFKAEKFDFSQGDLEYIL